MADKSFYTRLQRLFSTGAIVRNVGGKKLKIADTDKLQGTASNMMRERYARLHSSGYGAAQSSAHTMNMAYQSQRIMLFRDYDIMDMDSIVSSVLDIYADEATIKNEEGEILKIECDDAEVKSILYNLYYDILNVEFNLYMWIRSLCKYGDFYLFLEISPEYGIHNVVPLSVYDTVRVEGSKPENPFYVYFETMGFTGQNQRLENFEMAHFRLIGDPNFLPYGKCLSWDTHVDTKYGSKYISELQEGEEVWTFNLNSQKFELSSVKKKVMSGEKEILRISTPHNFLKASHTHPILTYTDGDLQYKKAQDVKIGDLLVLHSNTSKENREIPISKKLLGSNKNGWKNSITNVPDYVNEEFSELIGFLMGDGWIHNNDVVIALGVDDRINKKYCDLLEKYAGREGRLVPGKKNSGAQFMVGSKMLCTVLRNMGFVGNVKTKRIPHWVFESSEGIQLAFINGITNADGSTHVDEFATIYQLMLCNKDLVYDVKRLLQMNNIKSSIPNEDHRIIEKKICGIDTVQRGRHYIYYYIDGNRKSQMKKYDRGQSDTIILEPVRRIESDGIQEVWDIQVESKNSNFVANGLVVHNSVLEGGRRVFRQLLLMEDAMLIHRIMRAPAKRVFKVDVGNIPPNEIDAHMEQLIQATKKAPFIDPNTGQYNLKYNIQNLLEDFYFPVRGKEDGATVENLDGPEYQAIEDIEYLKNRLMAAFKVPRAFLGYEEALSGKTTLAAEDARFARTIERVQRIVQSELYKIGIIHLYAQGYEDAELINFDVKLTNPSIIYEQEKINLWKERMILARDMKDIRLLSDNWIYENILNMSRDDAEKERKNIVHDVKRAFRYAQIEEGQSDPAKAGYPQDDPNTTYGMEDDDMGGGMETMPEEAVSEEGPGPGRPKKGLSYGQDNHPKGRDPIGSDELYKTHKDSKRTRIDKKRFPLSFEQSDIKQNKSKAKVLNEGIPAKQLWEGLPKNRVKKELSDKDDDVKGTYLDENVLEQ